MPESESGRLKNFRAAATMIKKGHEMQTESMEELEAEIRADLDELSDPFSQFTYLAECGKELPECPERFRAEEYRIPECQVKTWAAAEQTDGVLHFYAWSESMVVRGALDLIEEIYDGRKPEEIRQYSCGLLDDEDFRRHFTPAQRRGLKGILDRISRAGGEIVE